MNNQMRTGIREVARFGLYWYWIAFGMQDKQQVFPLIVSAMWFFYFAGLQL